MVSRLLILSIASLSLSCKQPTCYNDEFGISLYDGKEDTCPRLENRISDFVAAAAREPLRWPKEYIKQRISGMSITVHASDDRGAWWIDYPSDDGGVRKAYVGGTTWCNFGIEVEVAENLEGFPHEMVHAVDHCECAINDERRCSQPGINGDHAGWIETGRYAAIGHAKDLETKRVRHLLDGGM